jgi:F0F1-type ATP synthase delta subunit
MFQGDRWAEAFINALDSSNAAAGSVSKAADAEEGLAALCALAVCCKGIHLAGTKSAFQMEKLMRQSAAQTGVSSSGKKSAAVETSIRFIALLIQKNLFANINLIIKKIGKIIDQRNGILELTLESAQPMEGEFQDALKKKLIEVLVQEQIREVRIVPRILPELLGGCRLLIGSESIDASLRGRIQKMAADLDAISGIPLTAGGNAW